MQNQKEFKDLSDEQVRAQYKKLNDDINKGIADKIPESGEMTQEEYEARRGLMKDEEVEQITEELKNNPLFWKGDEFNVNQEGNEFIEALSALKYDDTPENIAEGCNTVANNALKKDINSLYFQKEAMKSYTEGIYQKCTNKQLNAKLYNNRALVHIKWKNYGKSVEDCRQSIKQNENFVKAYYRGAQASILLSKWQQALEFVKGGLKLEPSNKDLLVQKRQCDNELQKENEKLQKKQKLEKALQNELFKKCFDNQITLGPQTMQIPESYNNSVYFKDNELHTPIIISYPQFQTTDFINDAKEQDKLIDHLETMFEGGFLPFDQQRIYNLNNIEVYIECGLPSHYNFENKTYNKGFKKVDINQNLMQILQIQDYVVPMFPELILVCKQSQFYEQFRYQNKVIN